MKSGNYIAIDLGASSGRIIVEHNGELDEIYRFKDYLLKEKNSLVWDIPYIYKNILIGLRKAVEKYHDIESLAIDSWGVDYVLMNNDRVIYPAYSYRDERTTKSSVDVHQIISFNDLYKITGIQFVKFNTIYQLKDDLDSGRLETATDFLHIPEYFAYLLTGKKVKEYTMASTTGLLDLKTGEFSKEIIDKLNLPAKLFPSKLNKPGLFIGDLKEEVIRSVGRNIPVMLTATHDTACAYESVNVDNETVIISSGTWSLIGVKLPHGNNSIESLKSNFTNEGGINYIRYLKNIMGMWIFDEVRKFENYSFEEIDELARESKYDEIFDVNDPTLLAPKDMRDAINVLLKLNPPRNSGDMYRSIFRSIATCYLKAIENIEHNINKKLKKICIVGGGAKNKALNYFIEKITHRKVIPVPVEAASKGNIQLQKRSR